MSGKQTIHLVRAPDDNDCLSILAVDTKAQIVINSIEHKMVHVIPKDDWY